MRLVTYDDAGHWCGGALVEGGIVDLGDALGAGAPASVRAALGRDPAEVAGAVAAATPWPVEGLRLGPPVPDPDKIICIGLNYRDHAAEAGLPLPDVPMFFAKFRNSLIGDGDAIVPLPGEHDLDFEGEVAIVIGRTCRDVDADAALGYVAGLTCFNDVTARDLQFEVSQWSGGKAIDTFGPCGPAIVTLDELPDIQALGVRTRVNGTLLQDSSTANMIFGVAEIVAHLSRIMTLVPGDLIATGTPAGIGYTRTPRINLRPGDVVEVEVEGLGVLRNPVAAVG